MKRRLISLDTETTGIDFYHGTMPFFVTTCDENDVVTFWEWEVDPLTRKPIIPKGDLDSIHELIFDEDTWLVLQNTKFDVKALSTIMPETARQWPWERTHDTLICGHVLASNYPHDLTSMGRQYLGVDISHLEKELKEATVKARHVARSVFPDWHIAAAGRPDMPSASGESPTGFDMWLPRAVVKARWENSDSYKNYVRGGTNYTSLPGWEFHPPHIQPVANKTPPHPWWTVLSKYSNADSVITINLWKAQSARLRQRKLVHIYEERVKVLKVAYDMETSGITISGDRLDKQTEQYAKESQNLKSVCENIANGMGYQIELPRSGSNKSVNDFVFNGLKLPPVKVSGKTGVPSLDKSVLEYYEQSLEPRSKAHTFIRSLRSKRKRDTALQYMQGYRRFWVPLPGHTNWWVLHPSLNPTGTATLRWSCSNPNEQNICFSADTECLTKNGWVRADCLEDGQVIAQYDPATKQVDFVRAEVHRPHFVGNLRHITTEENIDLLLTPNHRCLLRNRKSGITSDVRADEFKSDAQHIHGGLYLEGKQELNEYEVMWLCAVQADGNYCKTDEKEFGIRFIFNKERKIDRLRTCLQGLRAEWTEAVTLGGGVSFYIGKNQPCVVMAKTLMPDKHFGPWLLQYDRPTLDMFCDELFLWDGDSTRQAVWTSSSLQDAEWVQTLFALSGWKANLASRVPSSVWSTSKHHYVNVVRRDYSLTTNFNNEMVPHNGTVYCVTVPSSYLLVRRNGKVAVTGNSKQEGFNLRESFGPPPGWEWYSLDARNIELRIPAYKAPEQAMIDLFEKPNDPPYYGSNHLLNFHIIYPDIWEAVEQEVGFEKVGPTCKKKYASTWYQYCKNGGFAVQYGAIDRPDGTGTADRAFHRPGCHAKLKARFANMEALNQRCIHQARTLGYVETVPDVTVDPDRGYPLMCTQTHRGDVLPTVPLNYYVQGTAMWWMQKAMIRTWAQLQEWRTSGFPCYMVMQVHDELVFAMPKSKVHPQKSVRQSNLWRIHILRDLMEKGGNDIGVPTPVSIEYHEDTWGLGISL